MTVTSQRPLKILIRYKKRSLSSISLFLKVKWPSDSIKSGQLPTKCFGFGKYVIIYNISGSNITDRYKGALVGDFDIPKYVSDRGAVERQPVIK